MGRLRVNKAVSFFRLEQTSKQHEKAAFIPITFADLCHNLDDDGKLASNIDGKGAALEASGSRVIFPVLNAFTADVSFQHVYQSGLGNAGRIVVGLESKAWVPRNSLGAIRLWDISMEVDICLLSMFSYLIYR
jgi:hypothetical protein